jgi:hypothetical protein
MFVADNAFALLNNMKAVGGRHEKSSPERISNYRFNRTQNYRKRFWSPISCIQSLETQSTASRNSYSPHVAFDFEVYCIQVIAGSWRA